MVTSVDDHPLRNAALGFACSRRFKRPPKIASTNYTKQTTGSHQYLRHTAVSRMLNAGVPIAKVAKIVGWSPATMVRMAARYGHFSLNELRGQLRASAGRELKPGPWYFPRYRLGTPRRLALTN